MKSQFLLPETVARHEGTGAEIALGDSTTGVLLTLGITRIIEQESLDLTIWGSSKGDSWKQIAAFPQAAVRSDRLSSYQQWSRPLADALLTEFHHGMATLQTGEMLDGLDRYGTGQWRAERSGQPAARGERT